VVFELREITQDNLRAVTKVRVADDQRRFVADVVDSLAEAYVAPDVAWPRAVVDGDEVVGFVMGGFDDAPGDWWPDGPLHAVWRLNVAADHQGRGIGRFAVEQLVGEARRRGVERLTVFYVDEDGGPGRFYERLGFVKDGRVLGDEVVAVLALA